MTPDRDRLHFVLRRLHSLSGIVPIGLYLVVHIFLENAFILGGPEQWNRMAAAIGGLPLPMLLAAEVLVLWGPIAFHALYGLVIAYTGDLSTGLRYEYRNSYLYVLQRASGVVALFFIGFHVYTTRLSYYVKGTEIDYELMHGFMIDPLYLTVYLVGVLTSVFHFTNGLWTFCITWGITVGPRAQRVAQQVSVGLFLVMGATSVAILMAFR
jgi:succinate dehydrogenase / fumarate reductase cytochrome b subunit